MRLIVLSGVALSGCFFGGFPGLPGGDVAYDYKFAQTCAPAQENLFSKTSLVGDWQDWSAGSNHVVRFENENQVSLIGVDVDGKATRIARGTYSTEAERLSVAWDDGKTESMRTYVENIPGCEMLTLSDPEGAEPRLQIGSEYERVTCEFTEISEPAAEGTTPVEK